MMNESEVDPSLPLNDESLLQPPTKGVEEVQSPVLDIEPAETVVRFQNVPQIQIFPRNDELPMSAEKTSKFQGRDPPGHADHSGMMMDSSWQVDGSNHSIAGNSMMQDQLTRGLTMRDYEEQLKSLRKENFNLKLRIYFMEENKGLYHGPVEQENLYKINIDLKVKGEELKKELEEHKLLVTEAAKGLQAMEEKHKSQLDRLESSIRQVDQERVAALQKCADLQLQVDEQEVKMRETEKSEIKGISEESRILYNEAFGSFSHDSKIEQTPEKHGAELVSLKSQVTELTQELDRKIEENFELVQKQDDLAKLLDLKQQENQNLSHQLKDVQSTLDDEKSKNIETDKATMVEDLASLKNKVDQLETERDENLMTIVHQKRTISDCRLQLQESENKHEMKIQESNQLVARLETEIGQCNQLVSRLENELKQRSQEICTFLNLVKKLKRHPQWQDKTEVRKENDELINQDFIDLEDVSTQGEDLTDVISESRHVLEEIIDNVSRVSPQLEQHLEYEVKRNQELEEILHAREQQLEQLEASLVGKQDLEARLLDAEVKINQLQSKLTKKLAEIEAKDKDIATLKSSSVTNIDSFSQKLSLLEDRLSTSETNLKKSHICIQGFASENDKLRQKIKDLETRQSAVDNIERARLIKSGVDKAKQEYQACLGIYRGRYDKLRTCLQTRSRVMEMMRSRLEEITHFLARLLENGDDTLNLSNIDIELKDQIQNSIEQSMILTASLMNGSSILEEVEEIENDEVFDDDWVLPQVSLPLSHHSPQFERRHSEGELVRTCSRSNSLISLPASLSSNQNLPPTLSSNQNLPPSLSSNQNLPASQSSNQNLPPAQSSNQNLPSSSPTNEKLSSIHVNQSHESSQHGQPANVLTKEYKDLLVDLRDAMTKRREAEDALNSRTLEMGQLTSQLDQVQRDLGNALTEIRTLKANRATEEESMIRPKTPLGFVEEMPPTYFPETPTNVTKKSRIPVRAGGGEVKRRSSSVPTRTSKISAAGKTQTLSMAYSTKDSLQKDLNMVCQTVTSQSTSRDHVSVSTGSVLKSSGSVLHVSNYGTNGLKNARNPEKKITENEIVKSVNGERKCRLPVSSGASRRPPGASSKVVGQQDEEEDSYSEPDKEESRRRIGIPLDDQQESSGIRIQTGLRSEDDGAIFSKDKLSGREFSSLKSKVSMMDRINTNLEEENKNLETEKQNLQIRLTKTQKNLEIARGHITELMTEVKNLANSQQQHQHQQQQQQQQQVGCDEEHENMINQLQQELQKKKDELEEARSELNQARISLSNLTSQLRTTENKYSQEKKKQEETCNELFNNRKVIEELNIKINSIIHEREELSIKIDNITREWDEINLMLRENRQEEDKVRSSLRDAQQEIQTLAKDKEELGRTLVNLRNQVSLLEEKRLMNEALETEYNTIVRKNKIWEADKVRLTDKIVLLEQQMSSVDQLKLQIQELRTDNQELKTENSQMMSEHSTQVALLESKLKSVEKDCRRYENSASVAENLCTEYKSKYSSLRHRMDTCQHDAHDLRSQIHLKEEMIKTFQTQVAHKDEKIQSLKIDIDKYRRKLGEAQALMKSLQKEKADAQNKEADSTWRERLSDVGEENKTKSSSKYEVETAASHPSSYKLSSRSTSAGRRPLGTVDQNVPATSHNLFLAKATPELKLGKLGTGVMERAPGTETLAISHHFLPEYCCRSEEELLKLQKEFDEMKCKLSDCQDQLRMATDKISQSNRRKQKMEKAIVKELTKTRTVLKKAQNNLESCTSDS